jgi:hypothetical protein
MRTGMRVVFLVLALIAIGVGIVLVLDANRARHWAVRLLDWMGISAADRWRETGVPPWVVRLIGAGLIVIGVAAIIPILLLGTL